MARFYKCDQDDYFKTLFSKHKVTESDKQIITEYITEKAIQNNLSNLRKVKLASILLNWKRYISEPYDKVSMGGIYSGIEALKRSDYAQNTLHDYMRVLKTFLTWLHENRRPDLAKDKINKLNVPSVNRETTTPEELLTYDEIIQLIDSCQWSRDRAIISMLYESGVRIGELASIQWKHIVFDKFGIKLTVPYRMGKKATKNRFVRLTFCKPYVAIWRDDCKLNGDEDYVFNNQYGRPMDHPSMSKVIRTAKERAGIAKRVHPHLFRKTRITHMIKQNYSDSVIKRSMWGNLSTEMFSTYVVLSDEDADNEFLRVAGISTEERESEPQIKNIPCDHCHSVNPPTAMYCHTCGKELTEEAMDEQKVLQRLIDDNPEILLKYAQKLIKDKEMGIKEN